MHSKNEFDTGDDGRLLHYFPNLNFTQIENLYGDQFRLAPRQEMGKVPTDKPVYDDFHSKIIAIDTEREKQNGVGKEWPFEPLKPYECVISEAFAKYEGIKVGD